MLPRVNRGTGLQQSGLLVPQGFPLPTAVPLNGTEGFSVPLERKIRWQRKSLRQQKVKRLLSLRGKTGSPGTASPRTSREVLMLPARHCRLPVFLFFLRTWCITFLIFF